MPPGAVSDQSSAMLIIEILEEIEQRSFIYSYSWKRYKIRDQEHIGFEHCKVNHKYNFMDQKTHEERGETMRDSKMEKKSTKKELAIS
ncbi:hypothetical protein MXB_3866 [Myxobolus squamalis]|nr:hypothetical protein MXB_3866 [Myxobolus squamalis]